LIGVLYLVTLFRPRHDRPTFVHGVVALFERSADELFIVTVISHTALFWFLVVIASIVAEHYTGNILYKGNQFNTKVDYFFAV
jgi:hypothetical protein